MVQKPSQARVCWCICVSGTSTSLYVSERRRVGWWELSSTAILGWVRSLSLTTVRSQHEQPGWRWWVRGLSCKMTASLLSEISTRQSAPARLLSGRSLCLPWVFLPCPQWRTSPPTLPSVQTKSWLLLSPPSLSGSCSVVKYYWSLECSTSG